MKGSESLFSALDLPPEAQAIQDAYWHAEREWEAKRRAYELVLADVLAMVQGGREKEANVATANEQAI